MFQRKRMLGFGLIEVLVSSVILAVGLIGLASLQNRTIQSMQEGDNLVTASMIAAEMAKRMLSNPYVTAQGRQGYLAVDLNNDVANGGGVTSWAATTLASNPNITNCYSQTPNYTQSCYAPTATVGNSADHIQALQNMQLLDQVEMRLWAWNSLPQGQITICFDSTTAYSSWGCDNVATAAIPAGNSFYMTNRENVYTIKLQWTNIFTNTTQMYALQFTAECPNNDSSHCG